MNNSSVIEHAYIGVLAASRNGQLESPDDTEVDDYDDYYSEYGGVVRAYNSQFRNNERDALILNYIWYSQGDPLGNRCGFENCDFLTDGLLNHPNDLPLSHAELEAVLGIRFKNCSFRNTALFSELPIDNRGKGVYSKNSTFTVSGQNETFNGDEGADFQTFYRLRIGVDVNGAENHPFTVSKMEFQLNETGIYVKGACFETITYNNFEVPEYGNGYGNYNQGAYLMNSYLFTIEENSFYGDSDLTRNVGLVINNSSNNAVVDEYEVNNEVYRNSFSQLLYGMNVVNSNRGANQNSGLEARCNQFSMNQRADIYLLPDSEWKDDQGSASQVETLTNNVFSYPNFLCQDMYRDVLAHDDYGSSQNPATLMFQYHCLDDATTEPVADYLHPSCPQTHMEVVNHQAYSGVTLDYEEHCPSNFGSGGGPVRTLAQLEEKQTTAEANLLAAEAIYQATIDGGDTEDIIDLLENVLDEESAYLRDLLMERYPLSREALMAAIDAAESFDPWHLTQVLVANSRLPGDVYLFLKDNEVLDPFFMQFVDDAQTSGMASFRTLLKAEISLRSYEKSQAERGIHRHYLHHADSLDGATWNAYLGSREEGYYKLHRLGQFLDKGETNSAQTILDSLDLGTDRADWLQFMIDIAVADTVTSADISTGWDFFYNKPSTIGNAWGWLTAQGELDSIPPVPDPANHRSFTLLLDDPEAKPERWLQAWPNPAKDNFVLTYPREADAIGTVQVFGPKGEFIHQFSASDIGFEEINVTDWSPGLYIAKLIVEGKTIESIKINVVK